jgi:Family of unknown function (DUF6492)
MSISAVLPLKTRGRHYADNVARCDILFSSLRAFASSSLFSRIVIVAPHEEYSEISRYAQAWRDFPIDVIDEAQHFQAFARYGARYQIRPWHRQQIIKLYGSELVDTEYFLVLDPDIFATQPFDLETLLPNGRALTYYQPRQREPRFWQASATVLQQDPNLDRTGTWWTPALLSRTLCQSLHRRLESLYETSWMDVLLSRYTVDWTEYTLYWLNAEREGLLNRYHQPPAAGMPELHVKESVWFAGPNRRNLELWDAASHFAPGGDGLFAVIQSNTGFPVKDVAKKLGPYFPIALQPYERHQSLRLRAAEFYSAIARRMLGLTQRVKDSSR